MRAIVPVLANHGVEYEREHFEKKLLDGTLTVERTRNWLRMTIRKMVDNGKILLSDLTSTDSRKTNSYVSVHNAAVMQLITCKHAICVAECPEVLLLDMSRLSRMHASFHQYVQTAVIFVVVAQRLRALKVCDITPFLETISERIVCLEMTGNLTTVIATVCDEIDASWNVDPGELESIRATLFNVVAVDKPIAMLLSERLVNMIISGLAITTVDPLVSHATTKIKFNEFEIPTAVLPLAPHIRAFISTLRNVIGINSKVHSAVYNSLISSESIALVQAISM